MSLWSLFDSHTGRSVHKWKHYFPIYEQHFGRFVNRPCLMIEIGVGRGGSLQLWKSYLGPHAQIVGLDINPECRAFEEDQIAVRVGDQSDPNFLASVIDEFGTPDIVLDDGRTAVTLCSTCWRVFRSSTVGCRRRASTSLRICT